MAVGLTARGTPHGRISNRSQYDVNTCRRPDKSSRRNRARRRSRRCTAITTGRNIISNRFARSLGYLDWASQPRPFRGFADAPVFPLYPTPGVAADGYAPGRATFDQACQLEVAAATAQRRGHRRHAQACAGALGVEALQHVAVGAAGEPVQRKPPPDRSVCRLRRAAGAGRSAGGVPLRGGSSCPRTALRLRRRRVGSARSADDRTSCSSR